MPFFELFGNEGIKVILGNYLKSGIIPFSMIFTGPDHADLLRFATAYAAAVNCLELEDDFCGRCRHCVEVEKGVFLDLNILEPEGRFYKKEQILFLIEDNSRKPLKGKRKINIVTEAERMNENSANAFLKVLEEPAASNVFILLTAKPSSLLATVRSRCQVLKFAPLAKAETVRYLVEQKGVDPERAALMANLCQGNPESLTGTDFDEFMERRGQVLTDLQKLISGRGAEEVLLDLNLRSRSREKFLDYFQGLVNLISSMLRDIMVLSVDKDGRHIINIDYKEDLMKLSEYISIDKVLFLIDKMERLIGDVHRNLNVKVLILEFFESYAAGEANHV